MIYSSIFALYILKKLISLIVLFMARFVYTPEMLDLIYSAGKAVYLNERDPESYREQVEAFGINWSSFRKWFIPAFRYMREGIALKGNLTQTVNRYLLERIYSEYGKEGLLIALKSFMGTIEYYESRGENRLGDRAIIEYFQNKLK